MNIGFDATAFLGPATWDRGIGNYARAQFKKMMQMDEINQYLCFNVFEGSVFGDETENFNNLKEYKFYCGKDSFLSAGEQYKDVLNSLVSCFIKNNAIDIFYITSPFVSSIQPYQMEYLKGVKVVATVYDVIPYAMKDIYLRDKRAYSHYMKRVEFIKQIDHILVISNSVKQDLINYFGIDNNKITVIYAAANEIYKKMTVPKTEKDSLYQKYGIKNKFILCTSGDDPRKNIHGTMEAYSKLPKNLTDTYQLVIVCHLSPASLQKYSEIISAFRLENRIILTNYVTDTELLHLYNLASLMAFPSKYEGFGLPVVEAFSCGVPVLTSNNSSLGEVAEGAAVLVDPFDVGDITKGLIFALTQADKERHIHNGHERRKQFTWHRVASLTIEVFSRLGALPETETGVKYKIAFFTPLPPLESGISDYSADILNALCRYVDIDVFIDDGYKPLLVLDENINVFNHGEFADRAENYFDVLYQVGNSEFHAYMFPYIQQYAGTVVLHDYNLHAVASHITYINHKDILTYKNYLLEDFPADEVEQYTQDLQQDRTDRKIYEMEMNGFITNYAKKVIVHSDEAREKLLRKNIGQRVQTIRSYAKIEPQADKTGLKKKYGYMESDMVFASFGSIQATKRAMPTLSAFLKLCREYKNVSFVFVGKLAPDAAEMFKRFVRENKMEDKVTVTGYVELDKFNDYIDLSDLCINLRYPYNGETSGSLMRVLAKGKCVVVNNIGSFGEIPDDCCIKIPGVHTLYEQDEADCIYSAMKKFISDESLRETISKNARAYAEENLDLEIIAKKYFDFLCDAGINTLNDALIHRIIEEELLPKRYNRAQIKSLSKTLAYSINAEEKKKQTNKLAIVIQRYGTEVVGGSEALAMQYAHRLNALYDIEVITTTCLDCATWKNHYPPGPGMVDGIKVIRFETTQPKMEALLGPLCQKQLQKINAGEPTLHDDAWVHAHGPCCPGIPVYINEHGDDYDAFIFFTYLYYPSIYGIPLVAEKSIFLPTAHEEPWIQQSIFKKLFAMPRYFWFLTEEEKFFVHRYFNNSTIKCDVVGTGINVPDNTDPERFRKQYNIKGRYMIYVGRVDGAKGCDDMISHFLAYKRKHPSSLKLVLIGNGPLQVEPCEHILPVGFVEEDLKYDGIAGAEAMICPSQYESLCIALLEGFASGVPALVNGRSEVLAGHCEKSGASVFYTNQKEFIDCAHRLLTSEDGNKTMKKKAVNYVKAYYTWDKVLQKLCAAVEYVRA